MGKEIEKEGKKLETGETWTEVEIGEEVDPEIEEEIGIELVETEIGIEIELQKQIQIQIKSEEGRHREAGTFIIVFQIVSPVGGF